MTEQLWDPQTYAKHARFVSDLGSGAVDLLAPQPGERILDLGCGDGALTEKPVAAGVTSLRAARGEAVGRRGIDGRAVDLLFLPTAAEHRARLDAHGFADVRLRFAAVRTGNG
jgi:hypothetical protein